MKARYSTGPDKNERKISAGEILTEDNLTTKRPGTGDFPASEIYTLYGKISKKNIRKNRLIKKNDIR